MAKHILISLVVHIALISLVWVGLPIPFAKNKATLSYSELIGPAQTKDFDDPSINFNSKQKDMGNAWMKLRTLEKPKR